MATNYPVNPRVRAFGKARIDIARRARSQEEWDRLWKRPTHAFPFDWGEAWKQCIEYKVDDFAAEVGFFIDVLGLPVNSLDEGYAQFTSPHGDFFFAVVPTLEDQYATPPDALRLQFMVADIFATADELQNRGIEFDQVPQPCQEGSSLYIGCFRTPHGLCVELWGNVYQPQEVEPYAQPAVYDDPGSNSFSPDTSDEELDEEEIDETEAEESEPYNTPGYVMEEAPPIRSAFPISSDRMRAIEVRPETSARPVLKPRPAYPAQSHQPKPPPPPPEDPSDDPEYVDIDAA